jgi:hypothetical protein
VLAVEIHPIQDAIVLRARGSELLILSSHVAELKKLKAAGDFSRYFLHEALVNRPARKLFEAWLRKDGSLWARIYKTVQTIESSGSSPQATSEKPSSAPTKAAKAAETVKEAPAKSAKKTASDEKTTAKPVAKTATKAADPKPAKQEKSAASKAAPAKAAPKAAAKSAAKKPAAKTAAAKPAAKKSSKK